MATVDPENYIKLFRLNDNSQDQTHSENMAIIPAGNNVFQLMFHPEYGRLHPTSEYIFSEEAIGLLLKFRYELNELFQDCGDVLGIAAVLWEDISRRLFERGFTVTGKQCSSKWEALYSEYLEIAQSDDEGKVSNWKYFTAFECFYKFRSKYIDSKILEDITEYLTLRSDSLCTSTQNNIESLMKTDEIIETSETSKTLKKDLNKEDFSTLSNEEDSQMLIEAIDAAQKILEENLRESSSEQSVGMEQIAEDMTENIDLVENFCWKYEENQKQEVKGCTDERETSLLQGQTKIDDIARGKTITETTHCIAEDKDKEDATGYQICKHLEQTNFHWDTDATQCFLDLRLYVEVARETKQTILRRYRTIVAFVSRKMLLNGYKVSETDCRKKWKQLLRCYNKEVQKMKKETVDQNRLQGVKKYFWEMDRVLRKSGLEKTVLDTGNFCWDQESIKKLISIRIPMENAFAMFKRYVILWQYVSSQMRKHNFLPTYNACSIKWMELREIYDVCSDCVEKGTYEENIRWEFYQDMRKGFEQNANRSETVINYNCSNGLDVSMENQGIIDEEFEKTSAQIFDLSASSDKSEFFAVNKLDTLNKIEDSSNENKTELRDHETNRSQNTLKIAIHHCNVLENIIRRTKSIVKNNVAGQFQRSDLFQIDSNSETADSSFTVLQLPITEENLLLKLRKPKTTCMKMHGAPVPDSRDTLGVKKQSEQCWRDIRSPASTTFKKVQNFTKDRKVQTIFCDPSTIVNQQYGNMRWTVEDTTLLIKFRISRELKFRNPSFLEIDLWKEIAKDMQQAGHNVCYGSCANRWYQLISAYKNSSGPETTQIIRVEHSEHLKLMESPSVNNVRKSKALKKKQTTNSTNSETTKFFWTDEAIKKLIGLRLSEEIQHLTKYSSQVAEKMQAAGYSTITPVAVTRKWSRLSHTYKKSLFRAQMGQVVKWQYFELMDSYMKSLNSDERSDLQKKGLPFFWTLNSVQKLIDLKLMLEKSFRTLDRKALSLLWKKVANAMIAEGFKVTYNECAMEWNFLIKAYTKTKRELCKGSHAVIGNYFVIMDEALKKLKRSNDKVEDTEEPIDYSVPKKERKLEDASVKNELASTGQTAICKTVTEIEKPCGTLQPINNKVKNLNRSLIHHPSNCSPVNSLEEMKKVPENNICTNSQSDIYSAHIDIFNKNKETLPNLRFALDTIQQNTTGSVHDGNCSNFTLENYDQVYSNTENVICDDEEAQNKKISTDQNSRNKILCDDKANNNQQVYYPQINLNDFVLSKHNILIQDKAIHSTENSKEKEMKYQWNEPSINLLIDLQIQHKRRHPGWPRPEMQWDKVAAQFGKLGYNYTSAECREKWYSLKIIFEESMAGIRTKSTFQSWPYYQKMKSIYQMFGSFHQDFRFILPKKRPHDNEEKEHLISSKKLAVSVVPTQQSLVTPGLIICDIGNVAIAEEKITIE